MIALEDGMQKDSYCVTIKVKFSCGIIKSMKIKLKLVRLEIGHILFTNQFNINREDLWRESGTIKDLRTKTLVVLVGNGA